MQYAIRKHVMMANLAETCCKTYTEHINTILILVVINLMLMAARPVICYVVCLAD